MKTQKYTSNAFQFFKSLIKNRKETEANKENLKRTRKSKTANLNVALTQMYAQENEFLFI